MSFADFEEFERKQQQKYDDIKLSIKPTVVVSIKLLRFRNVSGGRISDFFDTPDPEFEVSCSKVEQASLRSFKTKNIKDNVTDGEINEECKFVIPHDFPPDEEFPIVIELSDRDLVFDDVIGKQTIDAQQLKNDGKPVKITMQFGKNNGELEFEIKKTIETRPDFRFGLGLCPEEREFRKKRIPFVHKAMNNILGSKGPKDLLETPIVSYAASGGGYRAVIGMCGAMEALNDAGLMDVATYHSALSGGGWYLASAYALRSCQPPELGKFHDELRGNFNEHLMWELVTPSTIKSYRNYAKEFLDNYSLPKTLVNYFPGFLVAKRMFGGDKLATTLSDLASYVDTGEVPYPLIISIQVKTKVASHKFHAYVESSPHEIYIPSHGVGLTPEDGGSLWSNGIIVRRTPEYPLHFTIGMTGCAFSILLNQFFLYGDEGGNLLFSKLDEIRTKERKKTNTNMDDSEREAEIESEEETDDEPDMETETETETDVSLSPTDSSNAGSITGFNLAPGAFNAIEKAAMSAFASASTPTSPDVSELSTIARAIRKSNLFTSRDHLIGRTAKLRNFVLNFKQEKRYMLNPVEGDIKRLDDNQNQLIAVAGHKCIKENISSSVQNLSFIDAGILKNVPTDAVLRPQRGTDVMIVLDFSDNEADDNFSYQALLAAAAHSWQAGLKFPKIDMKEILRLPSKEFLNFPSDDDDCPTVLWFTLRNKQFKDLKDYKPKSKIKPPKGEHRPFNDFSVFGEDTEYGTLKFKYESYRFDQLRELMYYNVFSHVKEIKEALADAVERRRRRLGR